MQLITWAFRYVVSNSQVILAEVDFTLDGEVDGWCPIDEGDREEAVKEASGFLPINVDDMAVPSLGWANHPEVVEEVTASYKEALLLKLEEEKELEKRLQRELAMVNGKVMLVIQKIRAESEAYQKAEEEAEKAKEEALASIVFRVLRAPRLAPRVAKPAPAPTPAPASALIQKWIEKNQEQKPQDLSCELKLVNVNPNSLSGVIDRFLNGVVHSFFYEEKEEKLKNLKAKKALPKSTRARGNNSKPKGKRPWRENH